MANTVPDISFSRLSLATTTERLGFSFVHSEIPIDPDAVNEKIREDRELDRLPDFDDRDIVQQLQVSTWMFDDRGHLCMDNQRPARRFLEFFDDLVNYELMKYARDRGISDPFGADDRIPLIIKCFIRAYCGPYRFNAVVFEMLEPDFTGDNVDPVTRQRFDTLRSCAAAAHEWLQMRRFFPAFKDTIPEIVDAAPIIAKIVVLGPSDAGKSSLLVRYFRGTFESTVKSTVGVDNFYTKIRLSSGISITVNVWDTAGQERFQSIAQNYLRDVDGIFFVYSCVEEHVQRTSLLNAGAIENAPDRVVRKTEVLGPDGYFDKNVGRLFENSEELRNVPCVMFGNKSDLLRGREAPLPTDRNKYIFLGSAKTGENVQQAFSELVYMVAVRKYHSHLLASTAAMQLPTPVGTTARSSFLPPLTTPATPGNSYRGFAMQFHRYSSQGGSFSSPRSSQVGQKNTVDLSAGVRTPTGDRRRCCQN